MVERLIRRAKREIDYRLSPEQYIGEDDLALFRQAGVTDPKELRWIAKVKKTSQGNVRSSAYGLIRLHAMMQKDVKQLGPELMSKSTAVFLDTFYRELDEVFKHAFDGATAQELQEAWEQDREQASPEERRRISRVWDKWGLFTVFKEYEKATTDLEKAAVLTKLLNVFHSGGNPEGLNILVGYGRYPIRKVYGDYRDRVYGAVDFLKKLNNLGHQNEKKRGSKK